MDLKVSNLTFGYLPDEIVLSGIDFSISGGETMAIVGGSGCGKSTLLRLIAGILPQNGFQTSKGQVLFGGNEISQIIRAGKLAFMFQEPTLMPNLSVRSNIAFPLKIMGMSNDSKVNDLMELVGLKKFGKYLPKDLSGGMKTRVSLARSFITNPDLLLLDEPFSALDLSWKRKLYIELDKLRRKNNTTVVMVTHDIQEALLLSNSIIVLSKNGQILNSFNIESSYNNDERLKNISLFISEVYDQYAIPIQDSLITNINGEN